MVFLKEYTLLEELGKGGFATVYKVRHNEFGYVRAIRVLNDTVTDPSSAAYQKFLRECKVLLRLGNGNHHNIVHIYQPRLLENHALVEMDYVDGSDLAKYLNANANFIPSDEVIRMVEQISSALAYCHEDIYKYCMDRDADNLEDDPNDGSKVLMDEATRQRLIEKYKVIHNDIHSGNIMRRENGTFVLLDFGLAITGNDDVRNSSRHDNGAVEFKAPEKWNNDTLLTEQSDIYSFGIVMYEYLAGRVPFPFDKKDANRTEAELRLCRSHKTEMPPSIFELRKAYYEAKFPGRTYKKDYPDWLEYVIMRCLEKDPEYRFKNGKELNDFILMSIDSEKIGAAPVETTTEAVDNQYDKIDKTDVKSPVKPGKRKRRTALWISLFILAIAVGVGVYFFMGDKGQEPQKIVSKKSNKIFTVNDVQFEMVAVKGGKFTMGCESDDDEECEPNEKPAHSVTLSDFYIGKYEVTQELWYAVMGTTVWDQKEKQRKVKPRVDYRVAEEGDDYPMYFISWDECQQFVDSLNKLTGQKFRLPTEAEWEYAAKGGNKSHGYKFSGSDDIDEVAMCDNMITEVGAKSPNELGIYDMTGNVHEWCSDRYAYYFGTSSLTNPEGPSEGQLRTCRGGSWKSEAIKCRVISRGGFIYDQRSSFIGMRLAMDM